MSDYRGEMTPRELDELASAYLDGEATPEEAALVESNPRLQDLVEELRTVRNLVAAPVEPPSGEVQDQMIARALDQRAPVVPLESARRRLRSIPPQARVILAAAAVVALIAMLGVTLFEAANRGDDDMFANDGATSAEMAEPEPAMADEQTMEAPADEPASAPFPESDEPAEETLERLDADDSADDEMVASPEEEMMDDAEPIDLMGPEDESFDAEAPAEEAPAEPESAMAADSVEATQPFVEAPLVFDTQQDLENYAMQFVDDLVTAQSSDTDGIHRETDSLACPLFTDEEVELLARFSAVVEETELEVSIYTGADFGQQELLLVLTSPPPECAIHGPVRAMGWSTSP